MEGGVEGGVNGCQRDVIEWMERQHKGPMIINHLWDSDQQHWTIGEPKPDHVLHVGHSRVPGIKLSQVVAIVTSVIPDNTCSGGM